MSKHEIDIMWQQAMKQSIEDGEMFTRYHFAKLVAERALADPMREVQRLGQEIEQEPVALPCCGYTDASAVKWNPFNGVVQCHNCGQTYTPPQRKPLSFNEITAIEEKVYMRTTHKGKPAFEYAHALIRAVEAAHNIKENT